MKKKNIVSIIIPVYQAEKWLRTTVESVIHQTYVDVEIILIDDGSVDASGEICDELEKRFSFVHVLHKKNEGVSIARNAGLELATGDYVLFLDADDVILEGALEKLVLTADAYNADIVLFEFYKMSFDGEKEYFTCDIKEKLYQKKEFLQNVPQLYEKSLINCIGNKLYRRDAIENLWFLTDYSIYEDAVFCLKALERADKVFFLKESFYQYNILNGYSLMHCYKKKYYEATMIMESALFNLMNMAESSEEQKEWMMKVHTLNVKEILKNEALCSWKSFRRQFEILEKDKLLCEMKKLMKKKYFRAELPRNNIICCWLIWMKQARLLYLIYNRKHEL